MKFRLEFPQRNTWILCDGEEFILSAMYRAGIAPHLYGCRGGGCGICKIHLLSGRIKTEVQSRAHIGSAEEKAGIFLACRARPESDLKLKILDDLT